MPEANLGTIGRAEVAINAKMDAFLRDLQIAYQKMAEFGKSTETTDDRVSKFEKDSSAAGVATTIFGGALKSASDAMATLAANDERTIATLRQQIAETQRSTKTQGEHARTWKDSAESAAKGVLGIAKLGGEISLAVKVLSAGSPAFKAFAQSITGAAANTAKAGAEMAGLGGAVEKTTSVLKPLREVAGAAQIVGLASHFSLASAAAYALSGSVRQVANEQVITGLNAIPKALGPIGPIAGAATAPVLGLAKAVGGVSSAFATGLRVIPQLLLVTAAVEGLFALFRLGQKTVTDFSAEVNKIGGAASLEAVRTYTEAMKKLGISVENVSSLFVNLHEKTRPALEENQKNFGELEKQLAELVKQGNFAKNSGVELIKQATTEEQRFKAVAQTVTEAMQKGERLAAIKLAQTFLPPEMVNRLRIVPDVLNQVVEKAKAAEKISWIDQQNITRAAGLKKEIDEAYKILHVNWELGVMPYLKNVSLRIYGIWVDIVATLAKAVDWISKIGQPDPNFIGPLRPGFFARMIPPTPDPSTEYTQFRGGRGTRKQFQDAALVEAGAGVQALRKANKEGTTSAEDLAAALLKLKVGLLDVTAAQRGAAEATEIEAGVLGDLSQELDTKGWDKVTEAMEKHLRVQKAEAEAANQGSVALARLKVTTELQAQALDKYKISEEGLARVHPEWAAKIKAAGTEEEKEKVRLKALSTLYPEVGETIKDAGDKAAGFASKLQSIEWEKEIINVRRHAAALEAENEAIGLGAAALEGLKVKHQLTEYATAKHMQINVAMAKEMDDLRKKLEGVTDANEKLKLSYDIAKERQYLMLQDQEAEIAKKLEKLYGANLPAALGSTYAAQIRVTDALKQTRDIGESFVTDFVMGLRQGETALKSLLNALNKIADKLLEMAVKQLWQTAFGAAATGLGFGLPIPVGAAVKHGGGVVGGSGEIRGVPAMAFMGAPRFHLGADEVPTILQAGERVIPRGGGGGMVTNNFTVENHGADVQQSQRRNRSGGMDMRLVIRQAVSQDFASGQFDGVLSQRHGLKVQTARR